MAIEFHATLVDVDLAQKRVLFADHEPVPQHYLIVQRSDESPQKANPGMANIYIERDDQCWGGYGEIDSVLVGPGDLTLNLGAHMANLMGQHDRFHVTFKLSDERYRELLRLLTLIMRGCENRLQHPT